MIVRTEAIVLKSVNYGETSQVVTLFTRASGTVAVMAKGARSPRSKFGSALQVLSHIQVVYYFKPTREVHTLSEASHVTRFPDIYRDFDRMSIAARIVEGLGTLFRRPEPDASLFDAILGVLDRLNSSDGHWQNLLPYVQLRMCASLGFMPMMSKDEIKSLSSAGGFLRLDDGGIEELKPTSAAVPISRRAARSLGVLIFADLNTALQMKVDDKAGREVLDVLESYMRYQIEDFRPSKSQSVYKQLSKS